MMMDLERKTLQGAGEHSAARLLCHDEPQRGLLLVEFEQCTDRTSGLVVVVKCKFQKFGTQPAAKRLLLELRELLI